MPGADDLLEILYPKDGADLEEIWGTFHTLHPNMHFYRSKRMRRAESGCDPSLLTTPLRNCFFPDEADDEVIQEKLRVAINLGVGSLNALCQERLEGVDFDFRLKEVDGPLDLLSFLVEGRKEWIKARENRHTPDHQLLFSAYEKVRAFGLGHRVLMIDESPEVLASRRHYTLVLEWFDRFLGFEDQKPAEGDGFSASWVTRPGIRVFGEENPIRSRVKVLYPDGRLKYSSMLLKMGLKQVFFEEIDDYTGVELIVEDKESRESMIRYFSDDYSAVHRLEDFKDSRKKGRGVSPHSSPDFGVVKFKIRPAIPVKYPDIGKVYERIPVEVQVLTLEDDRVRRENPDVAHKHYKKKQFMRVFPAWFPRQVYEPLIRDTLGYKSEA